MSMKLILLSVTILLGLVFMALPDNTTPKDFFLFYDINLTFQTYVYFLFEHFIIIILSYIIAVESRQYKNEVRIFFWLQVLDLVDYVLTYNTPWFHVFNFPISMNVIMVTVFGLTIYNGRLRL